MDYKSVWKKKMLSQGTNETESRLNNSKDMFRRSFKDDPSYRKATLQRLDLTEEEIDIRIKNIDKTVNEKKIYVMPDKRIEIGSLISYEDKTFIVSEFEENLISPMCKVELCGHRINIPNTDIFLPCLIEGESYGVKIFQSNNDFFSDTDTKVKVTVQDNDFTRRVYQSYRFMIGNSKHGIYKVGDITVYNKGVIVFICKKDSYLKGLDDLDNNKCFNDKIPNDNPKEPTEYTILGEDSIKINYEYVYELNPSNTNAVFSLDEYTIENNLAQIVNQGEGKVVIKSFVSDEIITLVCDIDGKKITKDIMTTRR